VSSISEPVTSTYREYHFCVRWKSGQGQFLQGDEKPSTGHIQEGIQVWPDPRKEPESLESYEVQFNLVFCMSEVKLKAILAKNSNTYLRINRGNYTARKTINSPVILRSEGTRKIPFLGSSSAPAAASSSRLDLVQLRTD